MSTKFTLCLVLCVWLLSCHSNYSNHISSSGKVNALSVPTDSNTFYFPLKRTQIDRGNQEQNLDSLTNRWYSQILFALKEPILPDYFGPKEI